MAESFIYHTGDPDLLRAELLHELFEQQASARAGSVALVCAGQEMTYGELDRRANQLARFLRHRAVSRGDCVGLWLPRSIDAIVSLLAILKAGAAYVPLDPEFPPERVNFILSDCQARDLITTSQLADLANSCPSEVIRLDRLEIEIAAQSRERLNRAETGAAPEDLCYIIYTSGTTGKPKGVQIEHRSVCHLVRAEGNLFQVQPADRVYQGFSLAFDASVEEMWMAFFAGASLVLGTSEMVRGGMALSRMLAEAGVTVLSCVPTLLAMLEEDVPTMRLLILGGEACPPDLVKRWWKPTRRVVNTYGPTEATVIATSAECHPAKPVTIGRPIPNYLACILDEQLRPVPPGVTGELCLGGIGLARGYLGRPELTSEKFISLAEGEDLPQRFYRTGDLARWSSDRNIEFLGRIDTQVKIRGFRVELAEIEAVLLECPGIQTAAATLREDEPGRQQLVGYVVLRSNSAFDEKAVRALLRARLPAYMVPAILEPLPHLPTLAAGKVDRKRLPPPRNRPPDSRDNIVPPRTDTERLVAAVWEKLFAPIPVSVTDNFFLDLGGHSLLAARMVSALRTTPAFAGISVLDVYQHPTVEKLATEFENRHRAKVSAAPGTFRSAALVRSSADLPSAVSQNLPAAPAISGVSGSSDAIQSAEVPARSRDAGSLKAHYRPVPFWRHFFCGAAQFVSLFFILTFFALQWLTPYLIYTILIEEEYGFLQAILTAFASLIIFYPIMVLVPIVVKWVLIGRYKAGAYPLWGWFYFRWWLATTVEAAVPLGYLTGSPLLSIYLRLMGAKIGRNVHLATDSFATYDLLSIGDDSSINADSNLLGYTVENGFLKLGSITIGKRCFVGARAAIREDTVMEDESALEDLSLLPHGATIPRGHTWLGSPAAPKPQSTVRGPQAADNGVRSTSQPVLANQFVLGLLHAIGLLIFPVLVVSALFPGIVVMNKLNYLDPYYWYLLLAPLAGVSFIVLLALEIVVVKWLLLGRVKPGRYPLRSFYYFRKWFADQTMDLSLDILGPLYASVYLTPWYKLLGARLGRGAEMSTASFISPDLLSIGDESFIADSVSLGAPRIRDGTMLLGRNHIGKRSFIGNSAILPPDTVIGDSVLIGCLSVPPNPRDALREDSSWMGSPPIFLPQRQRSRQFSAETTFEPTPKLRILRAAIEFVRVISPSTGFIILISLMFSALLLLRDLFSLAQTLLFVPILYLGCALAAAGLTITLKWLLVWRYRPGEKPLWSTFVWRNELLNAMHEHLAEPFLIGPLTGTPFVCWYFRLLGAKIGRRVYMETTDFSEFDLVRIGDEAALNADCTIQTHLFEDRVMKLDAIEIGARCKVGAGSLVLYDTQMGEGAALDDLSLLIKGEALPAWTKWEGIPARPA
jgi:non-ribosomal peptide synthetase-like protein